MYCSVAGKYSEVALSRQRIRISNLADTEKAVTSNFENATEDEGAVVKKIGYWFLPPVMDNLRLGGAAPLALPALKRHHLRDIGGDFDSKAEDLSSSLSSWQ